MDLLVGILIFVAVVAALAAITTPRSDLVQRRLDTLQGAALAPGGTSDIDRPFHQRVLLPFGGWVLDRFEAVLPTTLVERVRAMLVAAGSPLRLPTFLLIWALVGVIAPLAVSVLVAASDLPPASRLVLVLAVLAGGWYLPLLWLRARVRARQTAIIKALPDSIDLVVTCVEAGLGIEAALGRVVEKVKGPFSDELRRALREIALGRGRREALRDISERTGVADVTQLVNAVVQAETAGVNLAHVIRVQADQMRTRRRQRAEEQAYKAPVKMIFPIVLFIFPSMFVVLLGPGLIQLYRLFVSG